LAEVPGRTRTATGRRSLVAEGWINMEHTEVWRLSLQLDEHDGQTQATVRLHTRDTILAGVGLAWRNPRDLEVAEIGDELAAARALSDLAHKLFEATVTDIETITHRPVDLQS
jgi:hypothetical protein